MKSLIALALGLGVAAASQGAAQDRGKAPVVVELYTSQGCSSCPPADAVMAGLAQRPDVIALALHVDYWDYIGWKDTLASPQCTARQKGYAAARGDGQVYTPQAVIDGLTHVVGADGVGPTMQSAGLTGSVASFSTRLRTPRQPISSS